MIELLALGAAYIAGIGPGRLFLLALTIFAPLALVPLILVAIMRSKRLLDDRAPMFCDGVASELRAGATLRSALLTAAGSTDVALGLPGSDDLPTADAVAAAAGRDLPAISAELQAVVHASTRSGGAAADLFDELAAISIAQNEIAHEVRVASAPARATAWFFVLSPSSFVAIRFAMGGLDGLLAVPGQRIAVVTGGLVFLAGLAVVVFLMWRTR